MGKFREPKVKNKYNLKVADLRKLVVLKPECICEPLFWRNSVIDAWCLSGEVGSIPGTEVSYWLGIYDENARAYKGKTRVSFSSFGGMCGYNFNVFFKESDIETIQDLEMQEQFMDKINYLLDNGILCKG